jgi:hypothetical protein
MTPCDDTHRALIDGLPVDPAHVARCPACARLTLATSPRPISEGAAPLSVAGVAREARRRKVRRLGVAAAAVAALAALLVGSPSPGPPPHPVRARDTPDAALAARPLALPTDALTEAPVTPGDWAAPLDLLFDTTPPIPRSP